MHHSHFPDSSKSHNPADSQFCDTSYIKTSWERCKHRYKLSQASKTEILTLTEREIREKCEPLEQLMHDSSSIIERVRQVARQSGYSVLISNEEGAAVKAFTDSDLSVELENGGIRLGTLWQESMVGTNGLGTCLEESRPVTVNASEHFGRNLQAFSCSAAPLIGADGSILGALNLSTFASGNLVNQALALNFVTETADEIEALIFLKAYAGRYIVSLSSEMLSTHNTNALIAFNDAGTIISATTPALRQLSCHNRYDLVGRKFQDTFELKAEDLAQSSPLNHQFHLNGHKYRLYLALLSAQNQATKLSLHRAGSPTKSWQSNNNAQPLLETAGRDPQLLQQAKRCMRVIDKGLSILLQGETGTGKEVWAKALHDCSKRKNKPFVAVNCAAIPESLIESELFGYGAGTFTGGLKSGKVGKIEASNGGTLFLDEIGDMPAEMQARLLRVLAEGEVVPLGEVKPVAVDINVICASHRDLEHYVSRGDFREDLYYRISVFKVSLPALRERQDKKHIIHKVLNGLKIEGAESISLCPKAEDALLSYHWPGNIRQLKNVLQYAVCISDGIQIKTDDLPGEVFKPQVANAAPRVSSTPLGHIGVADHTEKEQLIATLEQNRWIVTRAAKALGVSRSTLHRKIKMHGLLLDAQEH
ncbi:sigma-54-dependent Fis family transcriptional regulator [Marinobacter shengliensis]|uniref:sigma-54-dependent Fis family transcriptional regulator n=1 Tax=Marinobacter shengliensis TaxID=1389223 RepID=UPI0025731929|nr:sigma-54-dependent Fis family transcriptional regulator [Marinobacter shengliensis]